MQLLQRLLQQRQAADVLQAGVGDLAAAIEVQRLQVLQLGDLLEACVGDPAAAPKVQRLQLLAPLRQLLEI
jgi:hypothetical protein